MTGSIRLRSFFVTLPSIDTVRLLEDAARWSERIGESLVRITSATVSRKADLWFVCLAVEVEWALPVSHGAGDTIGVNLRVLFLATLSDGTVVPGPKALLMGPRKLRRLSR